MLRLYQSQVPRGSEATGCRGWCIPLIIITCVFIISDIVLQSKCFSDTLLFSLVYRYTSQGLFGETGRVVGIEGREPILTES